MTHFVGGGVAGTISAAVTCPLEVVKTRLQSSIEKPKLSVGCRVDVNGHGYRVSGIRTAMAFPKLAPLNFTRNVLDRVQVFDNYRLASATKRSISDRVRGMNLFKHFRYIIHTEGVAALWKGLGPILIGVVPSRAIYFCTYGNTKRLLNDRWTPNTVPVHMASAASAGFVTSTLSNPIWMVKTRLQLDHGVGQRKMNACGCGVTASYAGISETMIHFVTYEYLRDWYLRRSLRTSNDVCGSDFAVLMLFGGIARMIATVITYPHELARTRLREKGNKYTGFCNVLVRVFHEESWRAWYNGMGIHLIKTIPNSAVLMVTYELTVYLLKQ
ncbi:unnamed protein product [Soboliphyme baturini]|uniref:Mitochondrial carrier protein n=1 Tax=Soboliphyme baturini TaxID=241478 RepID=A0A183J2S6_9BILA|nr:unnamed protein product [Soboliphyme baturini]